MLDADISAQIDAVPIEAGRPMLVTDADEVLVNFAEHLARWLGEQGWRFRLLEYRLDGAIVNDTTGLAADGEQIQEFIDGFFREMTLYQNAIEGAADGLTTLSSVAQVIVLTNAPGFARRDRITNLRDLGIDYPLLINRGGKGRVLAELSRRINAPIAFVDDSPIQIGSAARHADHVHRVHFVGSPMVKAVTEPCPDAHVAPPDWDGIVTHLRTFFTGATLHAAP